MGRDFARFRQTLGMGLQRHALARPTSVLGFS